VDVASGKRACHCIVGIILIALSLQRCVAQAISATVPELLASPEKYNGKRISVTGYYIGGFADSRLFANSKSAALTDLTPRGRARPRGNPSKSPKRWPPHCPSGAGPSLCWVGCILWDRGGQTGITMTDKTDTSRACARVSVCSTFVLLSGLPSSSVAGRFK